MEFNWSYSNYLREEQIALCKCRCKPIKFEVWGQKLRKSNWTCENLNCLKLSLSDNGYLYIIYIFACRIYFPSSFVIKHHIYYSCLRTKILWYITHPNIFCDISHIQPCSSTISSWSHCSLILHDSMTFSKLFLFYSIFIMLLYNNF